MGRGLASKGKRDMSGPSWLNPNGEGEGDGGGVRVEREDKPRRRPKDDEDDLDVKKTGIQWKPLAFLLLMILPGLAPVLLDVFDKLQGAQASPYHTQHTTTNSSLLISLRFVPFVNAAHGMLNSLPMYHLIAANPYRPCLQEFYADWAPEKLGTLDETLGKYEGRERQLFSALNKKYGKRVQWERCKPKEEKKEKK